jgi:hypothetical protein
VQYIESTLSVELSDGVSELIEMILRAIAIYFPQKIDP